MAVITKRATTVPTGR